MIHWPWRKGTEKNWRYLPYIFGLWSIFINGLFFREYSPKMVGLKNGMGSSHWVPKWQRWLSGWWYTYPSEKSWSSSVGMKWHSQYIYIYINIIYIYIYIIYILYIYIYYIIYIIIYIWKNNIHVPNHQPGMVNHVPFIAQKRTHRWALRSPPWRAAGSRRNEPWPQRFWNSEKNMERYKGQADGYES